MTVHRELLACPKCGSICERGMDDDAVTYCAFCYHVFPETEVDIYESDVSNPEEGIYEIDGVKYKKYERTGWVTYKKIDES